MKVSSEAMSWYNKADQVWKNAGTTPIMFGGRYKQKQLSFKVASKALKAMWKSEFPKVKFPYSLVETSGNRYTWVYRRELRVNTYKDWATLTHDFSHWIGLKRSQVAKHGWKTPHCTDHAILEYRLAKLVIDKGWIAESEEQLNKEGA